MKEAGAIILIIIVFILAMIIVSIYLTYKIIQFIVVSVNLYKEMVQNQKRMIELLKLNLSPEAKKELKPIQTSICPSCGAKVEGESKFCDNCGFSLTN